MKQRSQKMKRRLRAKVRALTNAQLLDLATKRKPPQRWYEEKVNPFERM
jgi:hypothetical protein